MKHWFRPFRHDKNMALAASYVERAVHYRRIGDPVKSRIYVEHATRVVVACGCPRARWDSNVQDVVWGVVE